MGGIYKDSTFIVNLEKKTCGCRQWDTSEIPCIHALAVTNRNNLRKEEFVSPYLLLDSYKKSYAYMIAHLPYSRQWPDRQRNNASTNKQNSAWKAKEE